MGPFIDVPVLLAVLAAGAALLGFPLFYWVQDRRRRGQPLETSGVLGVAIIGILGVVAIGLFILMRP